MSRKPEITSQGVDVWGAVLADLRDEILADGGKTWSPYEEREPTSGYMVSIAGREERISVAAFTEAGETFLDDYTEAHHDEITVEGRWFGAWVANGYVYLDISEHVRDEATALRLARERDQLAYYDLAEARSRATMLP